MTVELVEVHGLRIASDAGLPDLAGLPAAEPGATPDLVIHLLAFGGWFTFLLAAEFVGPWRSARSIGLCALIAGAYAIMDEYSQTIPFLGRTAAFDDLTANLSGIVLAAIGSLVLARVWKPRVPDEPEGVDGHAPPVR